MFGINRLLRISLPAINVANKLIDYANEVLQMINTINKYEFSDAFQKMGRGDQFSYEGLIALFDYLEMLEDDIGEPIELDVISLCCEYSEYENLKEFQDDYGDEYETLESIYNRTALIQVEDTERFIIQQFLKTISNSLRVFRVPFLYLSYTPLYMVIL
jgi:hypothetical protein